MGGSRSPGWGLGGCGALGRGRTGLGSCRESPGRPARGLRRGSLWGRGSVSSRGLAHWAALDRGGRLGPGCRLAPESQRVAEGGGARAAPPGWAPGLPGRAQDPGVYRAMGTPGPPTWGEVPHPSPRPPGAQALNLAGLHVLFISVGLFSPGCESEAIKFMAGFNFSL